MSFTRYPEYRESEVDWLGEIPAAWDVAKFRHIFRESGEKIDDEVVGPMLSVSGYRGIEIKNYEDDNQRRSDEDLVGYRIVRPGQLVVNTMWLNYSGLGVSEHEGHVSPAYRSYWIEADVDPRFMHHLMRSSIYVQGYTQLLTGIRPNSLQMSRDNLMGFPVLLPPRQDQQAIAAFLDRETAKIDALVAEQERLIALLKEKRQAVISHAVTKGLDPDAPMKDSGIEWLGEIPAHWELLPLKRNWSVTDCKHVTAEFVDEGFPLASIREVQSKDVQLDSAKCTTEEFFHLLREGERDPRPGDLIFSRNATVGEVAQVTEQHPPFAMGQDVCLLRKLEGNLSTSFLQTVLKSAVGTVQMDLLMIGSTFKRINVEEIRTLQVPFPPPSEQTEIAQFAEKAGQEADELIAECVDAKTLLQERRAALISAAVTGKIDVRGKVGQNEMEAA